MLEEDECIDVDECKCEYAGELYKPGDKYDKPDSCETCTCAGGGAEDKCTEIKCNTKCKKVCYCKYYHGFCTVSVIRLHYILNCQYHTKLILSTEVVVIQIERVT